MSHPPPNVNDEQLLRQLAMQFRATPDEQARGTIAKLYAQAVERLIRSGTWHRAPGFDDQLPDAVMPDSFFKYWTGELAESPFQASDLK